MTHYSSGSFLNHIRLTLPLNDSCIRMIDSHEHWYLCNEARKLTQYDVDVKTYRPSEKPTYHLIQYQYNWRNIVCALRCFNNIYLHTYPLKTDTVITVTLDLDSWRIERRSSEGNSNMSSYSSSTYKLDYSY